ncbi:hypothetical protein HanRHA438_Chr15g0716911 [Helianthus annuus]|nr:hypothetical protein HanRHA438_Chr15g0716911 [Helianthus annuus]
MCYCLSNSVIPSNPNKPEILWNGSCQVQCYHYLLTSGVANVNECTLFNLNKPNVIPKCEHVMNNCTKYAHNGHT